jgi:hypothetical protein
MPVCMPCHVCVSAPCHACSFSPPAYNPMPALIASEATMMVMESQRPYAQCPNCGHYHSDEEHDSTPTPTEAEPEETEAVNGPPPESDEVVTPLGPSAEPQTWWGRFKERFGHESVAGEVR